MITKENAAACRLELPFRKRQQRTEQAARECLRKCGYEPLTRATCDFHEGVLTIRGNVATYYLKQMAQVLTSKIAEVGVVDNRLVVN